MISQTVLKVQVSVSDFIFLSDGGPRLGRLPASDEIVLVLYDNASRREMAVLPTFEDDLALYQRLLDADAKVVADTRMIADGGGEEAIAVRQFLEQLVATEEEGRLYRDIWVASKLPEEFITAVEPYVANNLLNMHPNADSFYEARLYPLAMMLGERFRESLPLILARATRGAGRMTSDRGLGATQDLRNLGGVAGRRCPQAYRFRRTCGQTESHGASIPMVTKACPGCCLPATHPRSCPLGIG